MYHFADGLHYYKPQQVQTRALRFLLKGSLVCPSLRKPLKPSRVRYKNILKANKYNHFERKKIIA